MFSTNLDILYFVLACAVGGLALVLTVFFIYLIAALSKLNKILKEIAGIGKVFLFVKKRLDHSVGHLGLIAEMIGKVVMHFIEGKIEIKKKKK